MCARFVIDVSPAEVAALFGLSDPPTFSCRYNVAPTDDVCVVRPTSRNGARECVMMRWGLVPFWADDLSAGARMINARCESVSRKPAFKRSFERRRCLIPASGFYEWKTTPDGKRPFFIHPRDGSTFAFAGLWETWRGGSDNKTVETCTILTTASNDIVRELHDRMPVIVPVEQHDRWLSPDIVNPAGYETIFKPAPAESIAMHPVSRRVNFVANDDPSLIEPIPLTNEPTLFG